MANHAAFVFVPQPSFYVLRDAQSMTRYARFFATKPAIDVFFVLMLSLAGI
jgi:hypothetical protein